MEDLLGALYSGVRLREGVDKLREFIAAVYLYEGAPVRELSHRLRLPLPVVAAIKNEAKKRGVMSAAGGACLTEAGKQYTRETLGYGGADIERLKAVLDAPDIPVFMFEKELAALEEIYAGRPSVDVTRDQSLCEAETGVKRALLMLRTDGLIGRRILFLGDDDLTSIAILLILKSLGASASGITALDTDGRILSYIAEVSRGLDLPVACIEHDLRGPLPEHLRAGFDCVFTDPPYTLNGITLFAGRAAQAFKPIPNLPFYLSFAPREPAEQLSVQRMLTGAGFIYAQIHERFNRYHGAQILGGVSDLTVLRAGETLCPSTGGAYGEPIYTNERNRTVREYRCKNCGSLYRVGHGEEYNVIGHLKEKGCADCGGTVFDLRRRV